MQKNRIDRLWSISLLIVSLSSLLAVGSSILGLTLPDALVFLIIAIDLLALPVLAFTTIKKLRSGQ